MASVVCINVVVGISFLFNSNKNLILMKIFCLVCDFLFVCSQHYEWVTVSKVCNKSLKPAMNQSRNNKNFYKNIHTHSPI